MNSVDHAYTGPDSLFKPEPDAFGRRQVDLPAVVSFLRRGEQFFDADDLDVITLPLLDTTYRSDLPLLLSALDSTESAWYLLNAIRRIDPRLETCGRELSERIPSADKPLAVQIAATLRACARPTQPISSGTLRLRAQTRAPRTGF